MGGERSRCPPRRVRAGCARGLVPLASAHKEHRALLVGSAGPLEIPLVVGPRRRKTKPLNETRVKSARLAAASNPHHGLPSRCPGSGRRSARAQAPGRQGVGGLGGREGYFQVLCAGLVLTGWGGPVPGAGLVSTPAPRWVLSRCRC